MQCHPRKVLVSSSKHRLQRLKPPTCAERDILQTSSVDAYDSCSTVLVCIMICSIDYRTLLINIIIVHVPALRLGVQQKS